ncbi:sirohydrochlorin cobaltochelatase [Bacteroides caecigallinarum]|uniref:sirohydrochlorin cobaltochelatase n=1 Tax=Bacteroides caecigallinarum TaxID=1411144 RepID=UPI00374CCB36|nr:sirohydrochlorin cobaltochelatase [Bacteroides caecigallinarum]
MKVKSFLVYCFIALGGLCMPVFAHSEGNFVHNDIMQNLESGDKIALLMVHFGTTHEDTRALTIDAINQKAKEQFPQMEIREAYTSRIIMRILNKRGVRKLNPVEVLAQLKAEGYTHVVVQSTNIIDGIEMESLRKDIAQMKPLFKEIRLGMPLLYTPEDYKQVIDCLAEKGQEKTFTILVGHGTYTPATAQYAMLDYMLQAEGYADFAVGTVEGYPTFDNAISKAQTKKKIKQVQLIPFMFVAGDHAKNDIAGDMKEVLEKKGYKVSVHMEGLGENPAIQQIYIDHINFIIKHKQIDIVDKKKGYANSKD